MFSNQKNKWNLGVKSNFENFEFWVMPISKSALVTTTVHQFQKLGLVLCMVFNQEFEFCVQTFFYFTLEKLNFYTLRGPALFDYAKLKEIAQIPLLYS